MAKYDFSNSRYARFFSSKENVRYLQNFIDKSGLFHTNHGWYLTQGRLADAPTPIAQSGDAVFMVKARALEDSPMMNLRAPLGDTEQEDTKGMSYYTGTIPDFAADGTVETATERDYKEKQFEEFGQDAGIVRSYAKIIQGKMDSLDATMTWMTAQLMTKKRIDYTGIGKGIQSLIQVVPANLVPATINGGAKVWADADCKVLTQMRKLEQEYREKHSYGGALVWQMTYNDYHNVFLPNTEVKEFVKNYRYLQNLAYTDTLPVTENEWAEARRQLDGISPIQVVREKERNQTHEDDKPIQGWADGTVVLRPAGDAVEFERKDIYDRRMVEKYGSSVIDSMFATTNHGLGLLMNTTVNNGRFVEWHTDLLLASVPALINFPNHQVIDITKADA